MTPATPTERNNAVANKVRVTQEPGVVREVDNVELADLARMGILHSFEHTPEAVAVLPEGYRAANKWRAPAKGDDIVTASPAITDTESE